MASRDRGVIYTNLWADEDWRALTHHAQWLYLYLLSCASLSNIGIADWRATRIQAMAASATPELVQSMANELAASFFVVFDDDTEEILVRSYLRHDGLLAKPNVTRNACKAFAEASSQLLRGVVAHELQRLHQEAPQGFGKSNVWEIVDDLQTILKSTPIDIKKGSGNGSVKGLKSVGEGLQILPLTTATSTSTSTATPPKGGGTEVPPTPFCNRHPDGTDKPCRGCKLAGTAYEKWVAEIEAGEAALKTNTAPVVVNEAYCSQHEFFPMPCDRCREERGG